LSEDQQGRLFELAADMIAEGEELKKRQKIDKRTAEVEAEARRV
jgi:hypothetical protein